MTARAKRVLALVSKFATVAAATAIHAVSAAPATTWSQAFPIHAAPRDVHFVAHYVDGRGARHSLEVWRRGQTFLHRRTDDQIDLYAVTDHPGAEARYRLFDRRRLIVADVTRTNLYRIGIYSDNLGLAHVLDPPKERYRIEAAHAPRGIEATGCHWKALVRSQTRPARSLVCWSSAWGLPMVIVNADGAPKEVFRIDTVDKASGKAAAVPVLPRVPSGYALVNVDEEVDPSAD